MAEDSENVLFAPFGRATPDPELFLGAVLDGWERQQRAKDFSPETIRVRRALVLKLVDSSGHYPWEWTLGDADDFFSHARGVRNLSHSTVRSYQTAIRVFCEYACDPRFPPGLDIHSFRRSYATHLITGEGFDVSFVQMQLGHEHAATTSIYSIPSPDYQTRSLQRVHQQTLSAAKNLPGRTKP